MFNGFIDKKNARKVQLVAPAVIFTYRQDGGKWILKGQFDLKKLHTPQAEPLADIRYFRQVERGQL